MRTKSSSPTKPSIDISSIGSQLVEVSDVHLNVNQEVVITTEDKMRLCLTQHLNRMERKRAWIAPFGVFIAIITALASATFIDTFLKADTWKAIFILSGLISFVWLLLTIKDAFIAETIDDVVVELKKSKIAPPVIEIEKGSEIQEPKTIDIDLRNIHP